MIIFFTLVFGIYFLSLIFLMIGWHTAIRKQVPQTSYLKFVSVVVPVRNEESHLATLIHNLSAQQYPKESYEVILVDDHSQDLSIEVIKKELSHLTNFRMEQLVEGTGKKHALLKGIFAARGEIIVTTDADCVHGEMWLSSINDCFESQSTKMIVGPVRVDSGHQLFSQFQAIEFTSLIATTMATGGLGNPIFCNGANLAFRKQAFHDVGGYSGNENIPSGDDEFLLRKILRAFPNSVGLLTKAESIVTTHPHFTMRGFIHQRVRWAGKWRFSDLITKAVALFVLVVHSCLLAVLVLPIWGSLSWSISIGLILLKYLIETVFLLPVSRFLRIRWKWYLFLLLQFIYPLYVVYVGIISLLGGYEWKGRQLGHKM